ELAGYPHYENVVSNLLAFFLLPTGQHQMRNLMLGSLLKCLDIEAELSSVAVEREIATTSGRIDLLITSDTHVILIENKIYHHADNNPFADYANYVRGKHSNKIQKLVVLTPFP